MTQNWEQAIISVSQGHPPEFKEAVDHYVAFVQAHAGGADGRYLKSLEAYEKSLAVKRQIHPTDLGRLANVVLPDAPRYVPAMVKAMLTSPEADSTGHCVLFNAADLRST